SVVAPSSVTRMIIGGTLPGSEHSQIVVGSYATLNGRLEIVPMKEFSFQPGQSFEILRCASRGGQFASVVSLGAGVSLIYGPTSVTVRVVCPADWNADNSINSADFFEFLNAFFLGDADFNNDNFTDSQDFFDYLAAFFGPCVD